MQVGSEIDNSNSIQNKNEVQKEETRDDIIEVEEANEALERVEYLPLDERLKKWYLKHRPPRNFVKDLVTILRE